MSEGEYPRRKLKVHKQKGQQTRRTRGGKETEEKVKTQL